MVKTLRVEGVTAKDVERIFAEELPRLEPLPGPAYEDDQIIIKSSVQSIPGCLGHPAGSVHYNKHTGWLTISGGRS